MRYSTKVFCWLQFFILTLYLVVSTVTLKIISQYVMRQEYDRAATSQKNTSLLFTEKIEEEPTEERIRNLSSILQNTIINEFEVINSKGKIIYSNISSFSTKGSIGELNSIKINTISISRIMTINNEKYLFVSSIIGNTDYYLVTKQSLIRYESTLKKVTSYFCSVLFLFQIILMPMSFFLTDSIINPIQKLIERVTEIAKGQRNKEFILDKRGDEIEALANSLNEMSKSLKKIIKQKEEQELFVSSLSHEIRTPLTSIIGYAQMLKLEKLEGPPSEFISFIFEESCRLKNLSDNILRLIQHENDVLKIELVETRQIEAYIKSFISGLNDKIKLRMDLQEAVLLLDFDLFKVVVTNILSNSLEAMTSKGSIRVTGRITNKRYYMSFEDDGHGIPEKNLKKVTDEFYTSCTTRNSCHLGLGLSLVKKIVHLHNGQVKIISKENYGTKIIIDFNLDEDRII